LCPPGERVFFGERDGSVVKYQPLLRITMSAVWLMPLTAFLRRDMALVALRAKPRKGEGPGGVLPGPFLSRGYSKRRG
jgi:cytochrome c-type biogenesis protein CcmH/NrfF